MKAAVITRYGPPEVMEVREMPKPAPRENEVLIRVHAVAVTQGDCEVRAFRFSPLIWLPMRLALAINGMSGALIPGTDLAGVVEAVGATVTRCAPGDAVFGAVSLGLGGYAEYVCLHVGESDGFLAAMPANATYAEAAAAPLGGIMALQFLRKAPVQPGQRVLILGAGGSIGTCSLQLAKTAGAHVTAVDRAGKLEMLRSLGADAVIDFTREDFSRSDPYDVIFDVAGKATYTQIMRVLKPHGIYALANLRLNHHLRGLWARAVSGRRVTLIMQNESLDDLLTVKQMMEEGRLRQVVDRTYPLEEVVEAHRYVDSGEKRGNVVLTIGDAEA